MNIENSLLKEHSRTQSEKIAHYIGNDTERFKTLLTFVLSNNVLLSQRASWVMSVCYDKYPSMIIPHLAKLISHLSKPSHDAVKRNTLRILQNVDIPEKLIGKITDHCFTFLANPSEPIAIRVFSMSILFSVVKKHPDLKNELRILIEDQLPFASAGYQSRAKKVLKSLDKL